MSSQGELRELVAGVAAAYFSFSHVSPADIPGVIDGIAASLERVRDPTDAAGGASDESRVAAEPEAGQADEPPARAGPGRASQEAVRLSVRPDALVSFEDNRPYKTLRRHLAARGLTPQAYREKWGLPSDYPMVAPDYSAARSQLAKSIQLSARGSAARRGRKRSGSALN
jgi:predicted transcriptional regulator